MRLGSRSLALLLLLLQVWVILSESLEPEAASQVSSSSHAPADGGASVQGDGQTSAGPRKGFGFAAKVGQLVDWLTTQGGRVNSKVKAVEGALGAGLATSGGDRGLVASENIAVGEVLIFVPKRLCVHARLVEKEPAVVEILEALTASQERCRSCTVKDMQCLRECRLLATEMNHEARSQIASTIWLLQERQLLRETAASEWRPWLDLLPSDFSSSPMALPEAWVGHLFRGTELEEEIRDLQSSWRALHEVLSRSSVTYRRLVGDYKDYETARLTVLSRVHGLGAAGSIGDALVPMADLLNHDAGAPTWWGPVQGDGFQLVATEPIPAGTAITCSYGNRSSKELLLHYGFAPRENKAHSVELHLGLDRSSDDWLAPFKKSLLLEMDLYRGFRFSEEQGFAASTASLRNMYGGGVTSEEERDSLLFGELLAFLRGASLNKEDMEADAHVGAALDMDQVAIERLRISSIVLGTSLEGRAAQRLAAGCSERLVRLEESGLEGPTGLDLRDVAASVAAYRETERQLYKRLRRIAETVAQLVAEGRWPAGVEAANSEESDEISRRYLVLWAKAFSSGREEAAAAPTHGKQEM